MAGSSIRGDERKCPRMLEKDTTVCLCDLPDAILIHILSFLPTKSAVSTSLLSRRWRYLWTSTPNLELLDYDFKCDYDKFMTFAERALVLRAGSSLVSFSLLCSVENESLINTWITSAIQRNVEQLTLNLWGYKDSFFLPFCIFGCQSLVELYLGGIRSIRVPSVICLPRLKRLSLRWVEFEDNESAEKLLSHPLLEQLILDECTWDNITTVNVNSPKLQSLSINDLSEDDWSVERQVCFFGDNLKFFRYMGELPPTLYCICGSTMQLRGAEIWVEIYNNKVQDMDGPSNRYCKLVNSLSGVQNLTLSEDTAQSLYVLSQCPWLQTTLPVFNRLTRLNLKIGGSCEKRGIWLDSECLTMLYKRCPHLTHLNFIGEIELQFNASILRPMPSCFRTHLKKVTLQFDEYESDEEEYQNSSCYYRDAINLLFNSAPVLEEVVIHWKRCDYISGQVSISRAEELARKLNACPKVSENCRVFLVFV